MLTTVHFGNYFKCRIRRRPGEAIRSNDENVVRRVNWETKTGTDGDARALQSSVNRAKKKKTLRLPGDLHQHEKFRASRSVMISSHDVILNQ